MAAIAYVTTTPPFAELFGLPRWTVFAFFTASGMALISTILQTPLFFLLVLILRRQGQLHPLITLAAGALAGALAGLIFTFADGTFAAERLGDYRMVVFTTLPVGVVLAAFTLFAAFLRWRRSRP